MSAQAPHMRPCPGPLPSACCALGGSRLHSAAARCSVSRRTRMPSFLAGNVPDQLMAVLPLLPTVSPTSSGQLAKISCCSTTARWGLARGLIPAWIMACMPV
jgi:hypothetical protein